MRGAKRALNRLGRYRPPFGEIDEIPDRGLFEGVKGFQRDRGLKVDGVVTPKGETARALDRALAGQRAPRATAADAIAKTMKPAEPRRADARAGANAAARDARPAFKLSRPVGAARENDAQDVVKAKSALAWTGHYPRERAQRPDPGADRLLTGALAAFQRAQGLKVDGWMRPGGETERALSGLVETMMGAAQNAAPAERTAAFERRAPQDDEKDAALALDTKDLPHDGERCRILLERIERYRREPDEIEKKSARIEGREGPLDRRKGQAGNGDPRKPDAAGRQRGARLDPGVGAERRRCGGKACAVEEAEVHGRHFEYLCKDKTHLKNPGAYPRNRSSDFRIGR
ncbi:MAG: peptidoglycan-binding domain-containing protein [Marivibrio sp.]|uniref:peptidoglycan-binding domain-containing protein n=1 Tax=Marivibrio sp. TaxID=2039719 RepID=UPI0032EBA8AC